LDHAARLAVVDVHTRKVTGYIPIGLRSSGLAMAGDENTLYVADSFGGAIHVVEVKGHKVTGSIPLDRTPSGVVIDDMPGRGTGRVLRHLLRTRVPAFATIDNGLGPKGRNRSKTRGVIAGLVPAISIRMAQVCPIIGMAGTSPAMTKWSCHEFCPCY
jgi:YVTN family beta-propeller protein